MSGWSISISEIFSRKLSRKALVSKPAPKIITCSTPSEIVCSSKSSIYFVLAMPEDKAPGALF